MGSKSFRLRVIFFSRREVIHFYKIVFRYCVSVALKYRKLSQGCCESDIQTHAIALVCLYKTCKSGRRILKARCIITILYSRLSLSRPRLSRFTAYLEVKIWFLFKHENLTTCNKIVWKRGEIAPKEQFLLFSTIFSIYLTPGVKLRIYICEMWLFDLFFLNSANLICRGTDISKYFRQSLGIRDNESRL